MKASVTDAGAPSEPADSSAAVSESDSTVVAGQLGRALRPPWRVAARCRWGFPAAVVSPSRLEDGTPFPTFAWLTCPWLSQQASASESRGETALWALRAVADENLGTRLKETDSAVRALRTAESDGVDACSSVGIAGQRDPLGVKCLHAHVALALVGVDDPIGGALLGEFDPDCPDRRCARLTSDAVRYDHSAHSEEDQ